MEVIVKLPDQVLVTIFTEWIEIQDMCRLDTAVCNSQRVNFLRAAYSQIPYLRNDSMMVAQTSKAEESVLWSMKRGVGATTLVMGGVNWKKLVELERLGSSIITVYFKFRLISNYMPAWELDLSQLVSWCPNVTAARLCGGLERECIELLYEGWPHLLSMEVVGASDAVLDGIAAFEWLESVDIMLASTYTCEGLNRFLERRGSKLTAFGATVPRSGDQSIVPLSIARHCPCLKTLRLRGETVLSYVWPDLINACPRLMDIHIPQQLLTSADIAAIAQLGTTLQSLRVLGVAGGSPTEIMIPLLQRCSNLQCLHMDLFRLGNWAEVVVAVGRHCPNMRQLDMRASDAGLLSLAAGCPRLESFFANRSGVSDEGVTALLKGCAHLTELFINENPGVTDASLLVLPQLCSRMKILNVRGCSVTLAGISAVINGCRHLRKFYVDPNVAHQWRGLARNSDRFRPGLVVG